MNECVYEARIFREAGSLIKHGYKVRIIALKKKSLPSFEIINNIPVIRIYLFTECFQKKFLLHYLRWLEFIWKVVLRFREAEIYHCNDIKTLPIGVIIKRFFNPKAKIVYDAREYEIERNYVKGIRRFLRKAIEKACIKYADEVITVSGSIAEEYKRLYKIRNVKVILNTPPLQHPSRHKDLLRKELNIQRNQLIFLYQGVLQVHRGIEMLIETFSSLPSKCTLVLMGFGDLEDFIKKASRQKNNIFFKPAVSPDQLLEYTSSADYALLLTSPDCLNHYYSLPNKLFEYIMAEVPIIASNLYEVRSIIEKYKIGIVMKEYSQKGLKEAIEKILSIDKNELQKNFAEVKQKYNWENEEKKLLKVYEELI